MNPNQCCGIRYQLLHAKYAILVSRDVHVRFLSGCGLFHHERVSVVVRVEREGCLFGVLLVLQLDDELLLQ